MNTLDWIVLSACFAALLGIVWWSLRRNGDTADDYFLAGRNPGWYRCRSSSSRAPFVG